MDPDDGRIEHLNDGVADIRYGIQDLVPDAGLSPAVGAIIAGRIGTIAVRQSRQGAERKTQNMRFNTRLSSTRGMPRGLLGRIGRMTLHSRSVSAYRIVQGSFGELESHGRTEPQLEN